VRTERPIGRKASRRQQNNVRPHCASPAEDGSSYRFALALALYELGGRQTFADTLFIDEGFGALDSETLDEAIGVLETLQSQGRNVGVISHVEEIKERIPVQIRLIRQGGGRSSVTVTPALSMETN
jgi:DNA repair exonuclease SbcCD ATPase subunit